MSRATIDIYRTQISSKTHGIALFTPEPAEYLPAECQNVGVTIGDVGTWSEDGSFLALFNTCQPKNSIINFGRVPEGFEPFNLRARDISKRPYHSPGTVIAAAKVENSSTDLEGGSGTNLISANVALTAAFGTGALLVLPEGTYREQLLTIPPFRAYVARNAEQWYEFTRPHVPQGDSLFVVTGCDKTTSWGIATASGFCGAEAPLLPTAAGVVEGSWPSTYRLYGHGAATVRVSDDTRIPRTQNQCVFIRGFSITRKESQEESLAQGSLPVDPL